MKHLMRCLWLALIPAVVAYGEAGPRRNIEWISILRPADGVDKGEVVQQIWWSDGTHEIVVSPRRGIEPPMGKTEYSFDLLTGTYTSRHTPPARRERTKTATNTGNTFEVCDPMVEESCTPSYETMATGHIVTAYSGDAHGGAVAQLGVMPCIGDQDGNARVDFASANCEPKGLSLAGCLQRAPSLNQILSAPSILVQGVFGPTGSTQCVQRVEIVDDGRGSLIPHITASHTGVQAVVQRNTYAGPSCGYDTRNTGGGEDTDPPPDDPDPDDPGDGGEVTPAPAGEPVCVPVYDGNTGAYLGNCCGTTTEKIIKCAMEKM